MARPSAASSRERELYEPVLRSLQALFANTFPNSHLEITADRVFSNRLKSQIPQHRDLIFNFLREAAPDITGFIKKEYSTEFVVIEIKNDVLKLDDVYQARKYAELFDARYAVLVSPYEVSEELKRLNRVVFSLLALPAYEKLTLARFDPNGGFVEWFPENPFVQK